MFSRLSRNVCPNIWQKTVRLLGGFRSQTLKQRLMISSEMDCFVRAVWPTTQGLTQPDAHQPPGFNGKAISWCTHINAIRQTWLRAAASSSRSRKVMLLLLKATRAISIPLVSAPCHRQVVVSAMTSSEHRFTKTIFSKWSLSTISLSAIRWIVTICVRREMTAVSRQRQKSGGSQWIRSSTWHTGPTFTRTRPIFAFRSFLVTAITTCTSRVLTTD